MSEIEFLQEKNEQLPSEFEPYVKEWFWDSFDELAPPQKFSFDQIHNKENLLISAPTGSGKCITPDTPLIIKEAGNAKVLRAEELLGRKKEKIADINQEGKLFQSDLCAFSLNENLQLNEQQAKIYQQQYSGSVFKIKTVYGREIEVTPEHPLLVETSNGPEWKKAKKVKKGEKLGAPRKIKLPEKEIKLDPSSAIEKLREEFPTVITAKDLSDLSKKFQVVDSLAEISEDDIRAALVSLELTMQELAEEFGMGLTTVYRLVTHETKYKSKRIFNFLKRDLMQKELNSKEIIVRKGGGEITRFSYPTKVDEDLSELCAFLLAEGLIGNYDKGKHLLISQKNRKKLLKRALQTMRSKFSMEFKAKTEKGKDYMLNDSAFCVFFSELMGIKMGRGREVRFPNWILNASRQVKSRFVSTFLSLEAEVRKNEVRVSQANSIKIEQLNYLLLSFGIFSGITTSMKCATNTLKQKKRKYSVLTIRGIKDLTTLLSEFEIIHPKVPKLRSHAEKKISGNYIGKYKFDYKRIRALSKYYESDIEFNKELGNIYEVVRRTGFITDEALGKLLKKLKNLPSNETTNKLEKELLELKEQNIMWLEVKEKGEINYEGSIIDLVVPDLQNFVGGSGALYLHNTLGSFLSMLNELFLMGEKGELEDKVYVIYISPLRALDNDIEKNLRAPLEGIKEKAEELGFEVPEVRAEVRTGDTSSSQKSKQLKKPPHILITTPESLGIVLNAPKFKEKLKSVKYLIVDEIHSLCSNKRGVHLSLSLERLQRMAEERFSRIGLSATQAPIKEIAKFLVGYEDPDGKVSRGCKIAEVNESKGLNLKVLSPVEDLVHTPPYEVNDETYDYLHDLIQRHATTLIFTNTRAGTERVVHNLKKRFPDFYNQDNIGAHHGSMGKEKRLEVEQDLKQGNLKTVVSSTSLELGIDIGSIDLVLQMGSPKGIARAIQRVGRSGHQLEDTAKGRILIADRDDNLECSVMAKCAREDNLDKVKIPRNCLDVLSQHIVGMGCNRKWDLDEAYNLVRKSYNYLNLDGEDYNKTLKYVAGDYASLEDQHVYGKIWLDEEDNMFGRRGKLTRVIYMTNIGTIPDESNYKVYTRQKKNFVGTLDEEFLDRLTKKDVFVLGGSTYEFNYSKGMKVYVTPRPNASPTVPAWYSEMLPLSYDLGVEIGKFNDEVDRKLRSGESDQEIMDWILDEFYLNEKAANALFSYLKEQFRFSTIPGNKEILIEKTTDQEQNQLIVFHTIFGRRVNDALARAFADVLSEQVSENVGIVVDDHGFVLKTSLDSIDPVKSEFKDNETNLVPAHNFDEVDVEALVEKVAGSDLKQILKEAVRKTELMKRRFRHVAARALMILRNYKGKQKSVGKQQMKSHFLLNAAEKIDPDFPIIKETYREIMEDVMDLEHAQEVMNKIRSGKMEITISQNKVPSPFAHNLVIQGRSDLVLMGDKKERLQRLHRKVLQKING